MISVSHGSSRVTLCVGPYAFKIAKGRRGRVCNEFESALWTGTTETRRNMLCPILASMPFSIAVVMPRARPLMEDEKNYLIETDGFPDWDYVPPDETAPNTRRPCKKWWSKISRLRPNRMPFVATSPNRRTLPAAVSWPAFSNQYITRSAPPDTLPAYTVRSLLTYSEPSTLTIRLSAWGRNENLCVHASAGPEM